MSERIIADCLLLHKCTSPGGQQQKKRAGKVPGASVRKYNSNCFRHLNSMPWRSGLKFGYIKPNFAAWLRLFGEKSDAERNKISRRSTAIKTSTYS